MVRNKPQKDHLLDVEKAKLLPLDWHDHFDREIWQNDIKRPSYHNKEHIRSLVKSGRDYLDKLTSNMQDPLNVNKGIKEWNRRYFDYQVDLEFFKIAYDWAAYYHDVGNIMRDIKTDTELEPQFFKIYREKELVVNNEVLSAEERSALIVDAVISKVLLPGKKKKKLSSVVRHLILETDYDLNKDRPFALFMRMIDQIGSARENNNHRRVEGLLLEKITEDPNFSAIPHDFINFYHLRSKELLPDDESREQFLKILDIKLPDIIHGLSTEKKPGKEILSYVRGEIERV